MGRVYVADEYHSHINVFEPSGEFAGRWGAPGDAEGEMDGPSGLVFDGDDRLFVTDQNNNRVSVFRSDGAHIVSWGEPGDGDGQLDSPWGITLDSAGDVYVGRLAQTTASRSSPRRAGIWRPSADRATVTASCTDRPAWPSTRTATST